MNTSDRIEKSDSCPEEVSLFSESEDSPADDRAGVEGVFRLRFPSEAPVRVED